MFRTMIALAVLGAAVPSFGQERTARELAFREATGSPESDKAATAALRWIASHQLPDGSWSFDLAKCPACLGACSKAGCLTDARIAPTAIALWAMFRGFKTPERGDHQECVARGLKYLLNRAEKKETGWSFVERSPPFDSHVLAMIALCEAYGTGYQELRNLKPAVEQAFHYGWSMQNPDGGWGRKKSDVVSTAWYVFALLRYHSSGLDIPQDNFKRLRQYVESIGDESELHSEHDSWEKDRSRSTTASLFCRIHFDNRFGAPLTSAVNLLAAKGHDKDDMIYDLFAGETLILHGTNSLHQDKRWRHWNVNQRDWLVAQQTREGHEAGSWGPSQSVAESLAGGRLYSTAMATLILRTYYVHRWCNCGRGAHHHHDDDFPL